jgi:hypothetical protein
MKLGNSKMVAGDVEEILSDNRVVRVVFRSKQDDLRKRSGRFRRMIHKVELSDCKEMSGRLQGESIRWEEGILVDLHPSY